MNLFLDFRPLPKEIDPWMITVNLIVGACVVLLFISILINFVESKGHDNVKKEKKSIVETGTMTLFFFAYYYIIAREFWRIEVAGNLLRHALSVVGALIVVFGCIVNITGRLYLGRNWANQIKIYEDQTFVKSGVYKIVRHPLYASIIWMFYGASLIYLNLAAFLANTFIFIPFMYYRARQEEQLLTKQFEEYKEYKKITGMFFPKLLKGRVKNETLQAGGGIKRSI